MEKELFKLCGDIRECAHAVWDYVLTQIKVENMEDIYMTINVPSSVHSLLETRFNQNFDCDDRDSLWEIIYAAIIDTYDRSSYQRRIDDGLVQMLHRNTMGEAMSLDHCEIYDCDADLEWNEEVDVTLPDGTKKHFGDMVTCEDEMHGPHLTVELHLKTHLLQHD